MVGKRVRSRVDQRSSFLPSAALSLCARRLLWLQRIISATASRVVSQRARRWRCGKRRMYFYAYVEEDALESATHRAAVRSVAHGSPIRKGSVAWLRPSLADAERNATRGGPLPHASSCAAWPLEQCRPIAARAHGGGARAPVPSSPPHLVIFSHPLVAPFYSGRN